MRNGSDSWEFPRGEWKPISLLPRILESLWQYLAFRCRVSVGLSTTMHGRPELVRSSPPLKEQPAARARLSMRNSFVLFMTASCRVFIPHSMALRCFHSLPRDLYC